MKRIGSVLALVAAVGAFGVYRGQSEDPPPPNILFIMADDLGWPFYGFMRREARDNPTFPHRLEHDIFPVRPEENEHEKVLAFQTPNLDALAARGAVFPAGHAANSVCHPSFKTTLTGVRENHYQGNYKGTVEQSMADYLGPYGQLGASSYETFGFGKIWHSSYDGLGFTCPEGTGGACTSIHSKAVGRREIAPLLDFIAETGSPWFAWYSPRLPHGPFQGLTIVENTLDGSDGGESQLVLKDFVGEFVGAAGVCQEHPTLDETDLSNCRPGDCRDVLENLCFRMRKLDGIKDLRKRSGCDIKNVAGDCSTLYTPAEMKTQIEQSGGSLQKSDFDKAYPQLSGMHAKYFGNILLLDFFVGQILREVDELEQENGSKTLILFISDNGFALPKSKKTFGEDGFRTPMMASLPGVIPADLVLPHLVQAIDFVPTIFHYAGMTNIRQFPQDQTCTYYETRMDDSNALGQDIADPCLEGESLHPYLVESPAAGREFMYGAKRNHGAYLRTRYNETNYRLNLRNGGELFDLDADQGQQNNLYDDAGPALQGVLGDWVEQLENWKRCGDPAGLHPKCL